MFKLFTAFVQLALLRRGPDSLPSSPVFLLFAIGVWLVAVIILLAIVGRLDAGRVFVSLLSQALSLSLYAAAVTSRGYSGRVLQTLTAVAGVSGVIMVGQVLWVSFFTPLLDQTLSLSGTLLLLLWSVQAEGHIAARAMNVPLLAGVLVAVFVFILQYALEKMMSLS